MCPGPPQYKHRRFARRRCFSTSDKDPRQYGTSISIGLGPLDGIMCVWVVLIGVEATIKHMFDPFFVMTLIDALNVARISDCHIALHGLLLL